MKIKDYCRVLGVDRDATEAVIKAAYRALMKIHHPDVGGDPEKAKEIEEAYRYLSSNPGISQQRAAGQPVVPMSKELAPIFQEGRNLSLRVSKLLTNQVFACPRECTYYGRLCRYKQTLSVESMDVHALKASTLLLQVSNNAPYSQQFDCRYGRGALVDQVGDFYLCHQICAWQHQPKYKETGVDLFPSTRATVLLWFPQLPPGHWPTRFVYKHKVLVRDIKGDWLDEELIELSV